MWPLVVPHTTLSVTSERRPDSGSGEQLDIDGVAGGREKKGEEVVVEVGEGRKEVEQVGEGLKEGAGALVVLGMSIWSRLNVRRSRRREERVQEQEDGRARAVLANPVIRLVYLLCNLLTPLLGLILAHLCTELFLWTLHLSGLHLRDIRL